MLETTCVHCVQVRSPGETTPRGTTDYHFFISSLSVHIKLFQFSVKGNHRVLRHQTTNFLIATRTFQRNIFDEYEPFVIFA